MKEPWDPFRLLESSASPPNDTRRRGSPDAEVKLSGLVVSVRLHGLKTFSSYSHTFALDDSEDGNVPPKTVQGYDSTDEQSSDDPRRKSRGRDKTTSQNTTNRNLLTRRRSFPSHKKSNSQSISQSQSTSRRTLKPPTTLRKSSIVTRSALESVPFIFLDNTEQDHTRNPRACNLCDTVDKLFMLATDARIVPLAKAAVVLSVSTGSSNNLSLPLFILRDAAEDFQALICHH